ncbi:aspartyl-phosphate phosphatase Spo0E family protein [Paenibacillus thiaminolyticus]|uniref:Aspartyl-phosphate phosphatase Spo0E family protein n=1 Tax=Paenibacillus thiaminolyticus TaxID=49283 RepID=A0A3A3GLB0_PANTH|nr:aspartyl-phosphate phosphatase Spo0E family protein [Paenibacillus thiaminolyticus]RJG25321.1 aspartyl-phosphate phosphatase Spo0E family protein [Paenibacillus thiaminolyticus]
MITIVHDDTLNKVNGLKQALIEIVHEKGKFTDDEVVRVSQQLDMYILEIQRNYIKRKYKRSSNKRKPKTFVRGDSTK